MKSQQSNRPVCEMVGTTMYTAGQRSVAYPVCMFAAILTMMFSLTCRAQSAGEHLPRQQMLAGAAAEAPVANAAFAPGPDAGRAEPLHARIRIDQTRMTLKPKLSQPVCDGRPVKLGGSCRGGADKRLFPEITMELFSFADDTMLGAAQIGTMIGEARSDSGERSYWHVIPQYGRVWKEPGDGDWSRAALPIMLVHNFENVAHQGLMTFLYKGDDMSDIRLQFVQQSTPWNTPEHFVTWATAKAEMHASNTSTDASLLRDLQARADLEIGARLEVRRWAELEAQYPPGALDGFGGPLDDEWIVLKAAVKDGVIYYQESTTPYGNFPYPHDMRFGIRSMTKSVTVPLALGRLSQAYGPYVLDLKIGDYVAGLHPGYDDVRFVDAANMATGMGGSGVKTTVPNDGGSGYVDDTYDDWYNGAPSAAEKVAAITRDTGPYPWGPGVVYRYRDRDFHLLGAAANGFLQAMRGPDANIWRFLETEVFRPIGIFHAPIVHTIEADGEKGIPWFHAGYYPTLDDMAKISLLYQEHGRHGDEQILHPGVAAQIFTTEGTLVKNYDRSLETAFNTTVADDVKRENGLYKMGFHYAPFVNDDGTTGHAPAMQGFSDTSAILHPNGIVSIRFAKAWPLPDDEQQNGGKNDSMDIVNRLPK